MFADKMTSRLASPLPAAIIMGVTSNGLSFVRSLGRPRRVELQGLIGIEYKWDHRDRLYKLIEINARSVSGNQLAIDCGVDFPYINHEDALGFRVPNGEDYRGGVKWLHLGLDVQALLALRRTGQLGFVQWLQSLRGVRSLAILDLRDLRPSLSYATRGLGQGLRRAWR